MSALDLFAGPGGWDIAAAELGIDVLGIEWDDAACATRAAAGLHTHQADVAALEPETFVNELGGGRGVDGLIASPPCQAWSMAGKREGEKDKPLVYRALADLEQGHDTRAELRARCAAEHSLLVVEPLRWALALRPTWIALEQVPPVLPLWEEYARILIAKGWRVWTCVLSAERYGVPQTRKRAILLADRRAQPRPPLQTHQRYIAPPKEREDDERLFDAGDRERIVLPSEADLQPWVSMAEALGWGTDLTVQHRRGGERLDEEWSADRPSDVVTTRVNRWQVVDTGNTHGGTRPEGRARPADDPSVAITSRADQLERRPVYYRNGNQENSAKRREDEPAPTLHFGHALNSGVEWTTTPEEPWRPHEYNARDQRDTRSGSTSFARRRLVDEPAPTIAGESRNDSWVGERPSTSVCGDPRISPRGYRGRADDYTDDGEYTGERSMTKAVRVTLKEAAILQSFPPNYPFQGTRTKKFEQVGNAVPPLLAYRVLEQLVGRAEAREAA